MAKFSSNNLPKSTDSRFHIATSASDTESGDTRCFMSVAKSDVPSFTRSHQTKQPRWGKPTRSTDVIGYKGNGIVRTKLKFFPSSQNQSLVAFVTKDPITKRHFGVYEDDDRVKKVCVLASELQGTVQEGVLYDATLVPMSEKCGYVVVNATPAKFSVSFNTCYVPKILYRVEMRFGNHVLRFNPLHPNNPAISSYRQCRALLAAREDLRHPQRALMEFDEAARTLIRRMESDGLVYIDR